MKDLIVDGVSTLGMSIIGYFSITRRNSDGTGASKDGAS